MAEEKQPELKKEPAKAKKKESSTKKAAKDQQKKKATKKEGTKKEATKKTAAKTQKEKNAKAKAPKKAVKTEPVSSVFNKPGQKHITPPKGDGTRGFYESLYDANPNSVIATAYCVEHGLFGGHDHQMLYEKYLELKKEGHLKPPHGAIKPQAVKFLIKLNSKGNKVPKKVKSTEPEE